MIFSRPLRTFDEDRLGRESLADYLTTFIKTTIPAVNENSFVLALNSPWGTGKTSFIQMWRDKLEKSGEEYNIITYNAWENDDCDVALIPLICSFSQLCAIIPSAEAAVERVLGVAAPRFINFFSKNLLHIDFSDLIDTSDKLKELREPNELYKTYSSITEVKDSFNQLVSEFTNNNRKLIIFIDELDRCRPTFAIETLETIKHFFDLKNVIFIISLDVTQLSKSIKTVYGDIESEGYLRRFFDYQIPLPKSSLKEFLSDRLKDEHGVFETDVVLLEKMSEVLQLSLREINVISKAYLRFLNTKITEGQYTGFSFNDNIGHVSKGIYLFFIALKYSNTELYLKLIKEGVKIDSIPGGESLIKSVFATSSHIAESILYYSPEMVNKTLDQLSQSDDVHERNAYDILVRYSGANRLGNRFYTTKLSDVVFNMVEYGQVKI